MTTDHGYASQLHGDHRHYFERPESASQYITFMWFFCPTGAIKDEY